MPNPNAFIAPVRGLAPAYDAAQIRRAEVDITVSLDGLPPLRLDPKDPRTPAYAEVLESLRQRSGLVYAETDPSTGRIQRLLLPRLGRVLSAERDTAGDLALSLDHSHARLRLPAGHGDFAAFEGVLREALLSRAPVLVTVDDRLGVIDIRLPLPGWPLPPLLPPFPDVPPPREPSFLRWLIERFWLIWRWPWWPWWWFGCLSLSRANQVFAQMQATSCAPLTTPAPCIPFLYPDDGCFARAHEMCRLMIAMGLEPQKVWIRGRLRTPTRNHPACHVLWGWHVAPTLCVRGNWFWMRQTVVIDPSLFAGPVSKTTWKSVQGDPSATLDDTSPEPYFHVGGDVFDPGYTMTQQHLIEYRTELRLRSINQGPPPYANCP
ncbi:MAG: protein-glutamine glutaminase family protein [Rubrivivax sp.]